MQLEMLPGFTFPMVGKISCFKIKMSTLLSVVNHVQKV